VSRLRVWSETDASLPLLETLKHHQIAALLGERGVRFERWTTRSVPVEATQDEVLAAYAEEVAKLKRLGGYTGCDVISVGPDHPDREALRHKFLEEHTHSEDEVRFFVAGCGLFTLHLGDRVYEVLCRQGDLIGVPRGTPHWFDMGSRPFFTAVRLFGSPSGWQAVFTGSKIAERFPRHLP